MSANANTIGHAQPAALSLVEKLGGLLGCAVGVALFLTIGWIAFAPVDPLGPVSFMAQDGSATMFVQGLALALVAAGIATVLAGRTHPDIGTLAACLGIMAVSFRGSTGAFLLLDAAERGALGGLGFRLMLESVAWIVIVAACVLASTAIARWCLGGGALISYRYATDEKDPPLLMAGVDVSPTLNRRWGIDHAYCTPVAYGLKHSAVTCISGLLLLQLFLQGFWIRQTQHGQSCFVVAATVGLSAYVAHRLFPTRSAAWTIAGCAMLAVVRYALGWIAPGTGGSPVVLASNPIFRILPVQFLSVGTVTAILMFWHMNAPHYHLEAEIEAPRRPSSPSVKRHSRRART